MGKLTQYIQLLEPELTSALLKPTLTTRLGAAAATAGKRKATTSTASLQIDADINAAIAKAVGYAFQANDAKLDARLNAIDAKFDTRLNTMQQAVDARFANVEQAIANTHASHNARKQHTENAFASVNQLIVGLVLLSSHSRPSTQQKATPGNCMPHAKLNVWQWNCGGYRKRWRRLQQLVQKSQKDQQADIESIPDIHHDIFRTPPHAGTRALVALDLHKAFDSVQHAAIASSFAAINPAGLKCSESKSELLLIRPQISKDQARSLGDNPRLHKRHTHTANDPSHCSSVGSQARNEKKELLRLIHAFVIPRLTYALPYLRILSAKKERINRNQVRKVYKTALGLTHSTSTSHILSLGLHNTLDELMEAHRSAEIERLRGSNTGGWILDRVGLCASPFRVGLCERTDVDFLLDYLILELGPLQFACALHIE
ncbi:hypothetical protein HPB50_011157 [Hyalomma asiaticum]|uniref:Uncharacterized protein n=1 Tax=Hyalomma asiaticum TaxID=266040 RepID=A0ACB7TG15_HYAAI|nr:hypothetical protein HPB50_011157 [Hyalomma asiaticum]